MQETTAAAPTVRIIDLSARAPAKYRLRKRAASDVKNCPGPDIWREIGEWSIAELGLVEAKPLSTGSTLPPSWRGKPKIR
jgi:hypothetical protein